MQLRLIPADSTSVITPSPIWPLRSEAAELRAVRLAHRCRVSLAHAHVLDELRQASPARRG